MKRVLLSALLAATALQASAGILNGSFESGLAGWAISSLGSYTGVLDKSQSGTTDGSTSASVATLSSLLGGTYNTPGLENFVGVLPADLLAIKSPAGYTPAYLVGGVGPLDFFNGGAIKQTFTVGAGGDTLYFHWRFATKDPGNDDDFAFYVLDGKAFALGDTGGGTTLFNGEDPDADYDTSTDWRNEDGTSVNPKPPTPKPKPVGIRLDPGDHTLSFAVLQGNTRNDSILMVDNVRLQSDAAAAIPEPVSLGLVGLGLLAFGCNRRRKA